MGMGSVQDHLQDMINAENELGGLGTGEEAHEEEGLGGLLNNPSALMGLGALGSGLGYFFYKRRKKRQASPLDETRERRSRHRHRRRSSSRREGRRSSSSSRRRR